MKKEMKQVTVIWRDSAIHNAQDKVTLEAMPVCVMYSVGWLIGRNDDRIVIAREFIPRENEYRGTIAIPMENVVSIHKNK